MSLAHGVEEKWLHMVQEEEHGRVPFSGDIQQEDGVTKQAGLE